MGHFQRLEDHNLGLGWLYYSLVRIIRPRVIVVIGSWRGFAPMVFGKALQDNLERGKVVFIEPSLVDNFWKDAQSVKTYFSEYGITNINHYLMTTQQFVASEFYKKLTDIGIVFIDGYHSKEQVQFDYNAFQHLLSEDGLILLHDSISSCNTKLYGEDKVYEHQVRYFIDELKQNKELQVLDFPFDSGMALVRKL
jgi:predicted O-methyltransferase YrrM